MSDDGKVAATRPGSLTETHTIQVRYPRRDLTALTALVASVACYWASFGGHYSWAALAMTFAYMTELSTATRFQRDLKWVTGYGRYERKGGST